MIKLIICPKCLEEYQIEGNILNSSLFCSNCESVFPTPQDIHQRWFTSKKDKNVYFYSFFWLGIIFFFSLLVIFRDTLLQRVTYMNQFFIYEGNNMEILKNYIITSVKKNKNETLYFITNNSNKNLLLQYKDDILNNEKKIKIKKYFTEKIDKTAFTIIQDKNFIIYVEEN
jgi:hypothetical protein